MRDFILRIISQFQRRGADEAQRGLRGVEDSARQANRQAEPGRFRRFFRSIGDGARRATVALGGLIRQMRTFIGIGFAGAVTLIGRSIVRTADEAQRFAQITGTTNREAQQFIRLAGRMNVSVGALESGLRSLNRRVVDMEEDFHKAGIQTRDNEGNLRSTRDVFLDLSDVISRTSSAQERASITQRLMGQSGQQLLPILLEQRERIEEILDSTRALSDGTIDRVNRMKDEWQDFMDVVRVGSGEAFNELAEVSDGTFTLLRFGTDRWLRQLTDTLGFVRRVTRGVEEQKEAVEELGTEEADAAAKKAAAEQERLALQGEVAESFRRIKEAEEARAMLDEAAVEHIRSQLSANEQLENVKSRIDSLLGRINRAEEGSKQAAEEIIVLWLEQLSLQERISQEKKIQQQGEDALQRELEIMRARAAGDEARATQLERARRLQELTAGIVERTGRTEAEAREAAREKLHLEEQISAQKERQASAARRETEELTAEEKRRRELLETAIRDPLRGGAHESARARRELQRMGEISSNKHVADEQLLALQSRSRRGEDIFAAPGQSSPPAPAATAAPRAVAAPRRQDATASSERVADAFEGYHDGVKAGFEQIAALISTKTREIERLRSQIRNGRN